MNHRAHRDRRDVKEKFQKKWIKRIDLSNLERFSPEILVLPEIPPRPPFLKGGWGDFRGSSPKEHFLFKN
jgi:hypothetical protein